MCSPIQLVIHHQRYLFFFPTVIYLQLCMKSNEKCNQNGIIHICFISDSLNMLNNRIRETKRIFFYFVNFSHCIFCINRFASLVFGHLFYPFHASYRNVESVWCFFFFSLATTIANDIFFKIILFMQKKATHRIHSLLWWSLMAWY